MKKTVINLLRNAASHYSNTPYVNQKGDNGWDSKSFAEVYEQSGFFAGSLLKQGFEPDDRIAMLAEGRNDWVIAEYGILMAGCINVPLSIKLLPEEVLFRLNHAQCKAMIVSANTIEKAVFAIEKLEIKNFKLIFIDNDITPYIPLVKDAGLHPGRDVLLLKDMYEDGKNDFGNLKKKLDAIDAEIREDQVVTISYTSGTTGNPKGIMLTHLNYYANSTDAMTYFQVNEGDRLMLILPLDHSFAHTVGIYASAVRGLSIFFVDARGGGKNALLNIPKNLKEANPHFMLTVPALTGNFMIKMKEGVAAKGGLIQKLFEAGLQAGIEIYGDGFRKTPKVSLQKKILFKIAYNLIFKKFQKVFGNNIRYCVGGGALLDISQQRFFAAIGVPVYQGYGLTEATPIISANTPGRHKLGTSGMVLPGIECKIADESGNPLPQGKQGEIVIRGENVMKGYYLNPEATMATIRNGWLWTGDLGYFDDDGFLVVVGRQKALLISANGEKYSPEGIEEAIVNSSEIIAQAMVYNDMRPYTVAVIALDEQALQRKIKEIGLKSADEVILAIQKSLTIFRESDEYKNQFPEIWIPKAFAIAEELFTEQNQMINSTMKMVRHKVFESHKSLIESMYTANGLNPLNEHNRNVAARLL
jgi:long-chain acyl-CoA synthetase